MELQQEPTCTTINVTLDSTDAKVLSVATKADPSVKVAAKAPVSFPHNLSKKLGIFIAQDGRAYAIMADAGNSYALAVGSGKLNNVIRQLALKEGITLRKNDLGDINSHLYSVAEMSGVTQQVWYRVAKINNGIEIDVGDVAHTRIVIQSGKVTTVTSGSATLFWRTKSTLPLTLPAANGNLKLLNKYLNLHAINATIFLGWLTYTLASPKGSASKYVILILEGNQGAGKSNFCRMIINLLDPNVVGIQVMPSNLKDLSIAAQNGHVLCFDNVREFNQTMADALCIASTGGALTARQLYSDGEQSILFLHTALVLNGIHSFVTEADLAQRCLTIEMLPITESDRKSDADLAVAFQCDLPEIMAGLYELTAEIMAALPKAKVTNPQRMIDFVKWLAAMEIAHGAPAGIYQDVYADILDQGQFETVLENHLAAAVMDFTQYHVNGQWVGTSKELLEELNVHADAGTKRSKAWPSNPISLSKRLKPILHSLATQGIKLTFSRCKLRTITITVGGK